MSSRTRKAIKKFALPALGLGLVGYGLGGKQLPTASEMIGRFEQWLNSNADYPSLVIAGAVILLMWGGYQIFHWFLVTRLEKRREGLIKLRGGGVKLRNEGQDDISSAKSAANWVDRIDTWEIAVFEAVGEFSPGDAEDFRLLDVSPDPRLPIRSKFKDHEWNYQHHDHRLVKLQELIKRYRR